MGCFGFGAAVRGTERYRQHAPVRSGRELSQIQMTVAAQPYNSLDSSVH